MKIANVQDEFKPFPKANGDTHAHPRPRIGKTKRDKAKKGI